MAVDLSRVPKIPVQMRVQNGVYSKSGYAQAIYTLETLIGGLSAGSSPDPEERAAVEYLRKAKAELEKAAKRAG